MRTMCEIKIALSKIPYVYFADIVKDFEDEYDVKLRTEDTGSKEALKKLMKGDLDLAIVVWFSEEFEAKCNEYEKIVIGRDKLILAIAEGAKDLKRKRKISLEKIKEILGTSQIKIVLREEGSGTREQIKTLLGEGLVMGELGKEVDSNEEILAAISRSGKGKGRDNIKLMSLVSSVMCQHIRPVDALLIDIEDDTDRKYYAVRKKSDKKVEKVEEFWRFLKTRVSIEPNLKRVVRSLNESLNGGLLGRILPPKYIYGKAFVARYYAERNRVYFKTYLDFLQNSGKVWDCSLEDLRPFGKLKYPFFDIYSMELSRCFSKLREKGEDELMQPGDIADKIIREIVSRKERSENIVKVLTPILTFFLGVMTTIFAYFLLDKLL